MLEEFEFCLDEKELLKNQIQYCDIEINSPISDEDIRYAQLEDLIFREYKNELITFNNLSVSNHQNLSWNTSH